MKARLRQPDLFAPPAFPEGFRYAPDIVPTALAADLVERFATLPFKPFEFRGYLGNRRVVSFGWRYDYGARRLDAGVPIPTFLLELRDYAGAFAGRPPAAFEQALVTEYVRGAGIGWHHDKPQFDEVVAFSFVSGCKVRFKRAAGTGWERHNVMVAPRSAYILTGPARTLWQHSIPSVEALRYSVTFRSLVGTAQA